MVSVARVSRFSRFVSRLFRRLSGFKRLPLKRLRDLSFAVERIASLEKFARFKTRRRRGCVIWDLRDLDGFAVAGVARRRNDERLERRFVVGELHCVGDPSREPVVQRRRKAKERIGWNETGSATREAANPSGAKRALWGAARSRRIWRDR